MPLDTFGQIRPADVDRNTPSNRGVVGAFSCFTNASLFIIYNITFYQTTNLIAGILGVSHFVT